MKPDIAYRQPKSILNRGNGYLSGYTHSLNPYAGCAFGCSFCYVRKLPVSLFKGKDWGTWVDVKQEAEKVLRKEMIREKKKGEVTIFMSSSTDPYQPVERKERITRFLLETMVENPPDFLFVQTRSPLVRRDIDLLKQFGDKLRVSMTIETDDDAIRKQFSPKAPQISSRLSALEDLKKHGIRTQAAIAPVLPSTEKFPSILKGIADRVCIDDFYMGDGSGGKRTERLGVFELFDEIGKKNWTVDTAYRIVENRMHEVFSKEQVLISQDGFAPY
ncbi:SPL family radical SAM protein [Oceanobacillus kapialis]|uniref:Radical SAM protein n=1 Tax=Oceanobacillus kapialis TaxID=481353 RepID=A0ABW5Q2N7_9BACI